MSLQDELRRLHGVRQPYASGRASGQQAGNESYRLIVTGGTLEVLHDAADELDRLTTELAAVKKQLEGLEFAPGKDGNFELADMANIGYRLMKVLPDDYSWSQSPSEIVNHLQDKLEVAEIEIAAVKANAAHSKDHFDALMVDYKAVTAERDGLKSTETPQEPIGEVKTSPQQPYFVDWKYAPPIGTKLYTSPPAHHIADAGKMSAFARIP